MAESAQVKIARGTIRGDRNVRRGRPGPIPSVPDWLEGDEHRNCWSIAAAVLDEQGFTNENISMFGMLLLVDGLVDYRAAIKIRSERPAVAMTTRGNEVVDPSINVKKQAREAFLVICKEFGLTPISSMRLSSTVASEPDETEKRFFG